MFKNILVAVDGSELSFEAAKTALELASWHQSQLSFVYVVEINILLTDQSTYGQYIDYVGLEKALREGGEEILAQAEAMTRSKGLAAKKILLEGRAADEIARLAKEQGYDLIVMGTHGRGGLKRLVLGSVAESVVRQAPCPVLLFRSPTVS